MKKEPNNKNVTQKKLEESLKHKNNTTKTSYGYRPNGDETSDCSKPPIGRIKHE